MQNLHVSTVNIAGVPGLQITPNGDRWLHMEMHGDTDLPIRKGAKMRKERSADSGVITGALCGQLFSQNLSFKMIVPQSLLVFFLCDRGFAKFRSNTNKIKLSDHISTHT